MLLLFYQFRTLPFTPVLPRTSVSAQHVWGLFILDPQSQWQSIGEVSLKYPGRPQGGILSKKKYLVSGSCLSLSGHLRADTPISQGSNLPFWRTEGWVAWWQTYFTMETKASCLPGLREDKHSPYTSPLDKKQDWGGTMNKRDWTWSNFPLHMI